MAEARQDLGHPLAVNADIRVLCWNVYGVRNKDFIFSLKQRGFDIVCLLETHLLPETRPDKDVFPQDEYCWAFVPTVIGGAGKVDMIIGYRKCLHCVIQEERNYRCHCLRNCVIKQDSGDICITFLYRNRAKTPMKDLCADLDAIYYENYDKAWLVLGDFNVWTGREDGSTLWDRSLPNYRPRISKHWKEQNKEGTDLLKWTRRTGMKILNGYFEGDTEGMWTCVNANHCSVTDYGLANSKALRKIHKFLIGEMHDCDHLPLIVKLKDITVFEDPSGQKTSKQTDAMSNVFFYLYILASEPDDLRELEKELKSKFQAFKDAAEDEIDLKRQEYAELKIKYRDKRRTWEDPFYKHRHNSGNTGGSSPTPSPRSTQNVQNCSNSVPKSRYPYHK